MDPINRNRAAQNTMRDTSTHVKKAIRGAKGVIEETYLSHSTQKHSYEWKKGADSKYGEHFR